jgi:hypothetical protein
MLMKESVMTTRPLFLSASELIAASMSASLWTRTVTGSTANARAAAPNEPRKYDPPPGAVSGLNIIAARVSPGATSVNSSSHLPPIAASTLMNPVMLPPGRAKPATKPAPTGSETVENTIGIVRVSRCTAAVTGVVAARITSGCCATSSFANIRARATSPLVQRTSI